MAKRESLAESAPLPTQAISLFEIAALGSDATQSPKIRVGTRRFGLTRSAHLEA